MNNEVKTINGYGIKDETARNSINTLNDNVNLLNDSYIIDEITTQEFYDENTNTHYYITHVPNKDSEGNLIKLEHGFANDEDSSEAVANETAREFACRNNATFCVNASIFGIDENEENYHHAMGVIIKDGELISNYDNAGYQETTQNRMKMLGVKADNTLSEYPFNTTYETLINDGCVNTFCGYGCCMKDGVILTDNDEQNIWNLIGQNPTTKDLYFICCNGRGIDDEEGMSQITLANILKNNYGCDFAFRIDAGGSTCFVENGVMLNKPYDDLGQTIRQTPDYIYFSKDKQTTNDNNINEILNYISDVKASCDELYNKLKYLKSIDNNTLQFNFPTAANSANSGMSLQYVKNDNHICSLIMSPDSALKTLNIYDNENHETILRLNGLTGEILTKPGMLATIFQNNKTVDDLDDVINTSIVRCSTSTLHSPDSTYQWIVFTLRVETSGAIQIAIPLRQDQSLTPWKVRMITSSQKYSWYNLLTPSSVQ